MFDILTKFSYLCIVKIKMEMMLPREEKDSPTCTKKIYHVWPQKRLDYARHSNNRYK